MKKKERVLTENQQKFLDVLFEEAQGDLVKAKKLAGYSDNVGTTSIVTALHEEIRELTIKMFSGMAPKAAGVIFKALVDGNEAGLPNKLKAAQEVLNRSAAASQANNDVNLKVPQGGLFIMPAKDVKEAENEVQDVQEE